MVKKLIYVFNPMCGWCFGNSNSFSKLYEEFSSKYEIQIKLGAMWLGSQAPSGSKSLGDFVSSDSIRLKQITGLSPSEKFFELAFDETYKFDSSFPSLAISAVRQIDSKKLVLFIKELQNALFLDGKRLDEFENYEPILEKLRLSKSKFETLWLSSSNKQNLEKEFKEASTLANSYPTLLLEEKQNISVLSKGYFDFEDMKKRLKD